MNIETYTTCLPDIEPVLPHLATIIDADYSLGKFSIAEEHFIESGKDTEEWSLIGKSGIELVVTFEKYEGYLFLTLTGSGLLFETSKRYLYECYLKQGGDPSSQESPYSS